MRLLFLTISLALTLACGASSNQPKPNGNNVNTTATKTPQTSLPVYGFEIVKTYPHDEKAFTEGLFFFNGFLYESTGEEGESSLRKVEIATGKVVQKFNLPREDFGEGIAQLNGKLFMLTWRQGLGRVFDINDFKLLKEFSYQGDGWGMTTDGSSLFMTQGTHVIKVVDPETLKPTKTIPVLREDGKPLMQINELEYIKGEIWANIWHSEDPDILGKPNYIARIDPTTGKLLGWINLDGISPDDVKRGQENTLNGIAYDAATDRIFVTGKNWRKLFEIKITPPKTQ